jgi:hypothetical protein
MQNFDNGIFAPYDIQDGEGGDNDGE